ncbi:MAG: quinoprotein dehydrogenase-associated putative ABC transporter substrate-binding protein [Silvibacterium sp.]|nr:quinoprotein dehydrogenase-associated putative ABC transporter substrate-binding protein [Silvibacterium sp.]
MCSRFLRLIVVAMAAAGIAMATPLRICADPDNLPYSNRAAQGFDNRIAVLIAHEIGREPEFVWARSRRGFLRERFNTGACDALMGVPQGMRGVATSAPYYRSSYVFVTPKSGHLEITSFDDPQLDRGRIGLQVLEENYAPPSLPLIRAGHAAQLVGFEAFGEQSADIVRAVADGRIACAVVWGPLAGYYAQRDRLPVALRAVSPTVDASGVPFTFAIAIAVREKDSELLHQINQALARLQPEVGAILDRYNVPQAAIAKEVR